MDFELTETQRMLKDSVDRTLDDAYGDFERRAAYQSEPDGWSGRLWAAYADLGLLALPFAEADGGFGGGAVETMIAMESIGRSLALEPYLSTVVMGGGLLRLGATAAQRERYIPQIAAGTARIAIAQTERQARYDLHDVATTARRDRETFVLDGRKSVVLHGDSAELLVVSARTSGARRDRHGVSLFILPGDSPGITRHGYATCDGQRAAEIEFSAVRLGAEAIVGRLDEGLPLLEQVVDLGVAALAAEAVGAMEALRRLTVEYLKDRTQFGVPIGSFQALQHRAADMLINVEQARSMAIYAAIMAEEPDPLARRAAVAAAKVQINESARAVGQEAIQFHGGIAMTAEYRAGHYFKRLTAIENLFGDTDHHLRMIADAGGLLEAV